jgi:hemolysin activation/secretion protein
LLAWSAALCLHTALAQEIPRFAITSFVVEGNTLLTKAEIDATLAPFVGDGRDFGDIQRALEALELAYKKRGYPTASVYLPEQVLERGQITLRVVEGKVRAVRISGQEHFDEENILASLPALRPGFPPQIDAVSANLRVANENPAKKLTLVLSPTEEEGEIDAIVQVRDERPWRFTTTLDNSGTPQRGRQRATFTLQHANVANRDHVLSYLFQTSPEQPGDVHVHALAYRVPLYTLGDALDLYATRSSVNAGTLAAGPINLNISGKGSVAGARYSMNLPRFETFEPQLLFGFEHKRFQNNIVGGGVPLGNDITLHPLLVQVNGRWQLPATELSFFVGITRNLPGGANGRQADFTRVRLGAPADYSLLRGGFALNHAFTGKWQLRFSATGQWSNSPLVPGEQFGIGGASSVRGFDERAVAADKGMQATLELYTPELCSALGDQHRCRLLAFVDSGFVTRNQPLPGELKRESIASAGLGLRYSFGKLLFFQADYGRVIDGGQNRPSGKERLHARLGILF